MTVLLVVIMLLSVIWIIAIKNSTGDRVNIVSNGITVWAGDIGLIDGEVIITVINDPDNEKSPYVLEGNSPEGTHYNVIRITSEGACIIDSDCATHICIHEGITDSPAKPVVCLPNKLIITVTGTDSETDAVTY